MSSTQEDKSSERQRQRNRKAGQRDQKDGQQRNPKLDQRDDDRIDTMMASTDVAANGAAAAAKQPLIDEAELADVPVVEAAAAASQPAEPAASSTETLPINIQTIANAYRDYARKSFQENRFFVEKLMGVRSFDKAVEVQTDYARQACANFVAESQKICGLYTELARQAFSPWMTSRGALRRPGSFTH